MRISYIFITVLLSTASISLIMRSDDTTNAEFLKFLKSGNLEVKMKHGVDLKSLGLTEGLNVKDMWGALPSLTSKYVYGHEDSRGYVMGHWEPGLLEKLGDFLRSDSGEGILRPIREAVGKGVEGVADSVEEWFRNLGRPASYGDRVAQLRTMAYYGMLAATIPTVGILMKKGADVAIDVIKYKLTTPQAEIINRDAHPKYGRWDRIGRWWAGYKSPLFIFDAAVKEHLVEIEEKTKNIRDHIKNGDKKATYTNLLLYGPPGTGKTLFARVLADYANMDFLPTSAEKLLLKPDAFSEMLAMANHSSYGTIIFIDEADALFLDRTKLLQSGAPDALAQYRAVNNIMTTTGQRNNKFMIIAATNHAHVMDNAMNRRFPEKVEMTLPDAATRLELLNVYIQNELFNEKDNKKEFVQAARALLTPQRIKSIVEQTEGFSHAGLSDMIASMRDAARGTKDDIITAAHVNNAVARAVSDYKKAEENSKKRATMAGFAANVATE